MQGGESGLPGLQLGSRPWSGVREPAPPAPGPAPPLAPRGDPETSGDSQDRRGDKETCQSLERAFSSGFPLKPEETWSIDDGPGGPLRQGPGWGAARHPPPEPRPRPVACGSVAPGLWGEAGVWGVRCRPGTVSALSKKRGAWGSPHGAAGVRGSGWPGPGGPGPALSGTSLSWEASGEPGGRRGTGVPPHGVLASPP